MAQNSKIEWTDQTWNPVTGCDKVSAGCDHCYAETIAHRFAGSKAFPDGFTVTLHPDRLSAPLRWRKPSRVFVNSMSDLFHDDIPDGFIGDVFNTMALTPRHTFQILTKRPGRMRSLLRRWEQQRDENMAAAWRRTDMLWCSVRKWPLTNVWLGVSAEDQKWADIRIPVLLDTPASVRFVSAEPLLGPIDLAQSLRKWQPDINCPLWDGNRLDARKVLHWVIAGGESGRGARPMDPQWARQLRDQCVKAGAAFFFKQWGEWAPKGTYAIGVLDRGEVFGSGRKMANGTGPYGEVLKRVGKKNAGRMLDGRTWDEYPESKKV